MPDLIEPFNARSMAASTQPSPTMKLLLPKPTKPNQPSCSVSKAPVGRPPQLQQSKPLLQRGQSIAPPATPLPPAHPEIHPRMMLLTLSEQSLLKTLRLNAQPVWPDFSALSLDFVQLPFCSEIPVSAQHSSGQQTVEPKPAVGPSGSGQGTARPLKCSISACAPGVVAARRQQPPTMHPASLPPPPQSTPKPTLVLAPQLTPVPTRTPPAVALLPLPPPPPPLSQQPMGAPTDEILDRMAAKVRKLVKGVSEKQAIEALRTSDFNLSRAIDHVKAASRTSSSTSAARCTAESTPQPKSSKPDEMQPPQRAPASLGADLQSPPTALGPGPAQAAVPKTQMCSRKRPCHDGLLLSAERGDGRGRAGQNSSAVPPALSAPILISLREAEPPPRRRIVAVACDDEYEESMAAPVAADNASGSSDSDTTMGESEDG